MVSRFVVRPKCSWTVITCTIGEIVLTKYCKSVMMLAKAVGLPTLPEGGQKMSTKSQVFLTKTGEPEQRNFCDC
jgi:hypothetical protein